MRTSLKICLVAAVLLATVPPVVAFTLNTSAKVEIVPQIEVHADIVSLSSIAKASPGMLDSRAGRYAFRIEGPEDLCVNVSFGEFSGRSFDDGSMPTRTTAVRQTHDTKGKLVLEYGFMESDAIDLQAGDRLVLFLEYE